MRWLKINFRALCFLGAGALNTGWTQSQPTITTEQILATSTCSGQFLAVTYSTSGNFNWGNQFRAELSNNLGQFNNPVVIGWVPFNTGVIPAQIPLNTSLGIYRIRVVSTNPAVIGTPAPQPLLITNIPQATQIFVWPDDTVCQGDSIRLSVAPVFSNVQWSTGQTGYQIYVKSPGAYSVKTFDVAGCEGRDTVKVGFKTCSLTGISEADFSPATDLTVYPNPGNDFVWVKTKDNGTARVVITDISGRIVRVVDVKDKITQLDLSSILPGYYRIVLVSGTNSEPQIASLIVYK